MPVWDSVNVSICHHYYFPDNLPVVLEYFFPHPVPAPVTRLSHFVFLQISQMADDTAAELDRHLAVKTKELLG